ncbi:unnamed protein product [Calicophoron daubneyi]|uniref:Uncharacterized protein n=1 Tax=Calicophoron daubneyi TaxID=300641 RepID=A0AAV2TE06_CALDB
MPISPIIPSFIRSFPPHRLSTSLLIILQHNMIASAKIHQSNSHKQLESTNFSCKIYMRTHTKSFTFPLPASVSESPKKHRTVPFFCNFKISLCMILVILSSFAQSYVKVIQLTSTTYSAT